MSTLYYSKLLSKYKRRGALIDTNVLLVYFIGKYRPTLIPTYYRTQAYTQEDIEIIENLFKYFDKIITTPNILTEVSNLSDLQGEYKKEYYQEFRKQVSILEEQYISSKEVCKLTQLSYLGLTDSAIIKAVKGKYLVITDDFPLSHTLESLKIDVINLNHIRSLHWGLN